MSEGQFPIESNRIKADELQLEIDCLQLELDQVEQITIAFEAKLRAAIEDQLIAEQELTSLYKQLQRAKKEKRLEEKKKGKNYIPPVGLKKQFSNKAIPETQVEDVKERKRLYREAMLHVHPDKFSLHDEGHEEKATEVTAQLIEIYQSGTLAELKAFHGYIIGGLAISITADKQSKPNVVEKVDSLLHLQNLKEKLLRQLFEDKNRHTYVVWVTYEDPYSFIGELKEYYADRIFKLRKRTRKAR
ncbi:MAG: hypothetical protein OCD76_18015 [Reichenbachiella sp.]